MATPILRPVPASNMMCMLAPGAHEEVDGLDAWTDPRDRDMEA